jgi:fructosamine-3-kinase
MRTVTKRRVDAPAGFFEAEAAGLEWLGSAGGVRTASVIRVESGLIELERIVAARPTVEAAQHFGRELARTHAAGAEAFGVGPAPAQFIGSRPMPSAHERRWGAFYGRDRVLPFLAIAEQVGAIDAGGAELVRRACERISAGDFDDEEPPARIHGDLWNGNVLWTTSLAGSATVVLIDPAAHGGHRETDLAMLALFGCPYLEDVFAGYQDAAPLRAGWRKRVPLHQLHPLAVHAAGHGASYGRALADAAQQVLDLPGNT